MKNFGSRIEPGVKVSSVVSLDAEDLDNLRTDENPDPQSSLELFGQASVSEISPTCQLSRDKGCELTCSVAMLSTHGIQSATSAAQVIFRCTDCVSTRYLASATEVFVDLINIA